MMNQMIFILNFKQSKCEGFTISVFGIIIYRATFFGLYDTAKAMAYDDPKKAHFVFAFM